MNIDVEKINVILATDCGSTTSKARFFKKVGSEYRFVSSGEAPTTVEAPFEDVTQGVLNAIKEIEELTGHKILSGNKLIIPCKGKNEGIDLYVTTSSAGGGLQMSVGGLVKSMTGESAERAALGAGAIVMDILTVDDGRTDYERIKRIRELRPDMILLAGGTDGGDIKYTVKMSELIATAQPKPRLGKGYELPLIFAGNVAAHKEIQKVLGDKFSLKTVPNIRPSIDVEDVQAAREAIHQFFMEHVMSHAPGYDKLMKWTEVPIMPTPMAEGTMFQTIARVYNANVIGVGLGGATTNVYSVFEGKFVRTVSANLGMSYSVCNVLKEAGISNIMRWVPFELEESILYDEITNKMIRPTTIPQTLEELLIEHAIAREALRMGFLHHKFLARPLIGVQLLDMDISQRMFLQEAAGATYIDMMKINWIGGTGGLLSHSPRRAQSALILIDGFSPEGITKLAQDSVFMMPHLGVLSTVHPKAAMEIFEKDCLIRLGTCIAPKGQTNQMGEEIGSVELTMPDNTEIEEKLIYGSIKRIPLAENQTAKIEIKPKRGFDVGAGSGRGVTTTIEGGVVGIILDARGRPIALPDDNAKRREKLIEWFAALEAYPEEESGRLKER
jgi:uncharacterized protein (TIGR01319 family)